MITGFRAALLAALVAASVPAVAAGQDANIADFLRRIEILERANINLERRVHELETFVEALIQAAPSQGQPIQASDKWRDLANWRQLRLGMKMDAVRALLGEPERVDAGPITFWRWPDGDVDFMDGRVSGWSEPGR